MHRSQTPEPWNTPLSRFLVTGSLALIALFSASVLEAEDALAPPFLPNPVVMVSTVPANGDVNPYGVAFVPPGFPTTTVRTGTILVSNFNNSQNLQGTGSTIVAIAPTGGTAKLFFQGGGGLGLTTGLVALPEGLVVVGNFPSPDGTCGNSTAGSLLVIDANGKQLASIADASINGPWDMTAIDRGRGRAQLFVSNALDGTVVRIDARVNATGLTVVHETPIGSGYSHRCDPSAFVVGPTGLVYDASKDVLYVASTDDNKVFAIDHAAARTTERGTGRLVYEDNAHLHGPLGMAMAPNGNLLVANSDVINGDPNQPSEIVEFTINGEFRKQLSVDSSQGGSFGLAVEARHNTVYFAAVDDATNTLDIWALPPLP